MGTEKPHPEFFIQGLGQDGERQTAGVGSEDGLGPQVGAKRVKSSRLASTFSTIASSTHWQSPKRAMSSVKLPGVTLCAACRVKNAAGLRSRARSSPCRAKRKRTGRSFNVSPCRSSSSVSSSGTRSSNRTSSPALARWAAMAAPMTPAPITPTLRMFCISFLLPNRDAGKPSTALEFKSS